MTDTAKIYRLPSQIRREIQQAVTAFELGVCDCVILKRDPATGKAFVDTYTDPKRAA